MNINMKKNILYALALATTLVACTDDYTDWAAPQENGPEEAKSVSVSGSPASAIDFATSTAENVAIFSASFTAEEGATATYKVTLSPEDNSASTVLNSTNGSVPAEDLKNAVVSFYGKAPTPRILKAVVDAYVDIAGQTVKVTAPAIDVNVTLDAPQISEEYYLIGAPSSWNVLDTSLKFNHSGKNVYDDPVFTIMFPVTDGDYWFAVTDQISIDYFTENETTDHAWAQVFGCAEGNGANGEEGSLKRRADLTDDGSFKVVVDGDAMFIKMTLNMMDYTYKLEKINFQEFIYEIGNNTGWGNAYALHGPNYDGIYHGAMFLKSGFKFRSNANDWNGSGNWGLDADGTEGKLINDGNSKDISLTEDGFYKITVDLNKMEYTLTKFEKLGIIGDGQPGGWDTDTELTYDEAEKCWKATGVELTGGKSIKFRTVGDWNTVNIGGASLNNLIFNSNDNIPVAESGTFTVKLYLETAGQPYATVTKE